MTGGQNITPADHRDTRRLETYWTKGVGAAKIAWGTPGDFDRCVLELGRHVRDPEGLCANYHKAATGMWPAQHAALDRAKKAGH